MTRERIYRFDTTLRDGQQTLPALPAAAMPRGQANKQLALPAAAMPRGQANKQLAGT